MTYYPKEGKLYLAQLKAYAMKLGHVPSFKEANEAPELPPANNFAFYFGSYSDAAEIVRRELEHESAKADSSEEEIIFSDGREPDEDEDDSKHINISP